MASKMSENENYKCMRLELIEHEKRNAPLITEVLRDLDWQQHIVHGGRKCWITCRDEKGNRYTLYPQYDVEENVLLPNHFTIYRHRDE